jgi:glycosyltransferase involved in cell wall biosynthesis
MMRIGIDARAAVGVTDGIGRYALELLRAYSRMDNDHEYIVLKNTKTRVSFAFDPRFREMIVADGRFGIREQFRLPALLCGQRLDLFHSLHSTLPFGYGGVSVMTVHDIFPLLLPWTFGRGGLRNAVASTYLTALVKRSAKRAAMVIVDSEHTRRDMLGLMTLDAGRLRRVYLGIDHLDSASPPGRPGLEEGGGVPGPYLLTVTNFKPHKNTTTVIEAFRIARKQIPDLALAIVGDDARKFAGELGRKDRLAAENIHMLGFVDDGRLRSLMASAEAFVFPSLYEGFGFPILEAMAQGAPVISSAAASLPEVGGDAVLYVDPHNPAAVAEAVVRVCSDPILQQDLRERGKRQAGKFHWQDTALQTLRIYEESLGSSRSNRS